MAMKIEIVKPYGYCMGVSNAIDLAIKTRQKYQNRPVYVLGMLVHNDEALAKLANLGIKTLFEPRKSLVELTNQLTKDSVVILTAHGHAHEVEEALNERGITFIDATCPFVKKSHQDMIDAINEDRDILYLGKNGHPEAIAALSISSHIHLIEVNNPIIPNIECKNPLIISQTTFSRRDIKPIIDDIFKKYPNAEIKKIGICYASDQRQEALLSLDKDVDLIYVVGGKLSNNTKTLYRLALSNYPSAKVLMIENKDDINEKDLLGLNHIAISSGASTPMDVIEEIKAKLESINN